MFCNTNDVDAKKTEICGIRMGIIPEDWRECVIEEVQSVRVDIRYLISFIWTLTLGANMNCIGYG